MPVQSRKTLWMQQKLPRNANSFRERAGQTSFIVFWLPVS